jgi:Family of unknown function (DUF5961)
MGEESAAVMSAERRFRIYPRHQAGGHARVLTEVSFEAAAVAFVEDFAPAPDAGMEIAIHVLDLDSGVEHCFRIDLETGATSPCS